MVTTNNAFPLTEIDRQILAMTDEEFSLVTWEQLKDIIAANRLEQLKRRPSDLRRYIKWSADTKAEYNTITNFVVQERLHWTPLPSLTVGDPPKFEIRDPVPFSNQDDFKILKNDWPYGLDKGIVHICVWVKTPIETDPGTGDVTDHSRSLIENFVNTTFATKLDTVFGPGKGKEHVLWFKNWVALQSVRGVDHVHVLVHDAPEDMLQQWIK
ncbi:hypothetical protein AUEXF2481DRAFT_694690 [Aureobasidium subglaciale EXF-2481]|uniref:N-acetylglucosamine-induced protein 1 n=1 Tax=Aureobasidium subglaciale (strain EXF-2481) TaxID=1043005 RepID=A0A074YIH3_AURSE|nr:uncharacterized protein AUEXF2481DRAFT_694690 [Aureobasidium subglaciale EXF-2481]KAI5201764.1 hypothetical protein E4T38_06003 [Aureobasidium subglaciale]KAI5220613.1 hypothetical protein E4T40_05934 [Aureobasidium subglaciale]KAI5224296.1 hypothetical protein E4T41_05864 [Aureobasidium subglaciale]KAI5260706.1 hypothetical protein E4T46_05660 [Aureobasidium subglaciale]KEQ95889.1 hypothetical protein AUEXF2481DRAFT_694690 [Aureobasidium subglaciale EXF-2481]